MHAYDWNQLEKDAQTASLGGVLFTVAIKKKKAGKWEDVVPNIKDLKDAMMLASTIESFEVAIFAKSKVSGGFFYWSSKNPDLLSSEIIQLLNGD
jgi:hypothetical protein